MISSIHEKFPDENCILFRCVASTQRYTFTLYDCFVNFFAELQDFQF